jgi:hypothetical protein
VEISNLSKKYDLEVLKQVRTGTVNGIFDGAEVLQQTIKRLHSLLPINQCVIVGTYVEGANETDGWVTEGWGRYDVEDEIQVTGGIDTFITQYGKIRVK